MSQRPLLDFGSPFYSCTETASSFLNKIRGTFMDPPTSCDQYLLSFLARLVFPALEIAAPSSQLQSRALPLPHELFLDAEMNPSDDTFASFSPTLATRSHPSLSMRVPKVPVKRSPSFLNHNGDAHFYSTALGMSLGKRKYACISSQSTSFSDLCGSPKRMRSSLGINLSSYEIEKVEPFTDLENLARLSCSHSLSQLNNPDIIGHVSPLNSIDDPIVRESPVVTACHSATSQPSSQLLGSPNMGLSPEGLKDEVKEPQSDSMQTWVDELAKDGLLNARWLGIFAPTSVRILDLRKCFSTKYGFNRYFMVEALRDHCPPSCSKIFLCKTMTFYIYNNCRISRL
ncbi:hypothetical protein BGW80DRAFT_727936 [Lactifluus volemus]|nr:hypothetical protein BGW80DRAFT_727936 [Lactifluus volemus]